MRTFFIGLYVPMVQHPEIVYIIFLLVMLYMTWLMDKKYEMLRDASTAAVKSFSWARVQMAWWSIIILSAFLSIMVTKNVVPTFSESTIILLGLTASTLAAGRAIDLSDKANAVVRAQDQGNSHQNFFLDIMSDGSGVTIHRFQAVLFNLAFGVWFICAIAKNIGLCPRVASITCEGLSGAVKAVKDNYSLIIPNMSQNNLILLGLSSATYAALKVTENKNNTADPTKTGNIDNSSVANGNRDNASNGEDAAPRDTSMF